MYDNPSGQLHQRSITSAFNYNRTYSNTKHEKSLNELKLYLRCRPCGVRRLVRFMNSFKHFAFSISILLVLCFLRWRRHQVVANVEMFCKAETGWRSANILHHFAPLCPRPCAAPRRLYWHRMPRRQQSCSAPGPGGGDSGDIISRGQHSSIPHLVTRR